MALTPMREWSPQMRATALLHAKAQWLAFRDIRDAHPTEYRRIRAALRAENPDRRSQWFISRALNELARRHHPKYLARRHHHLAALRKATAQQRLAAS